MVYSLNKITQSNNFLKLSDILNKNYPYIKIDVAYPYRHKDWNDYLVYSIKNKENDIIIF